MLKRLFDTIYFRWITAGIVVLVILLAFVALWHRLITSETFGEIIGGAFGLQGSRTVAAKALDFGQKFLETKKQQITNDVEALPDSGLAARADKLAGTD